MSYQFNDIEVLGTVRGTKFPFRANVEAASLSAWGGATGAYTSPTLTISGLPAGSSGGALDGVTSLNIGSRVLIKDAASLSPLSSSVFNGIWEVSAATSTTTLQLVRAADLLDGDMPTGVNVWIAGGTQANQAWVCTSSAVIDTTSNGVAFVQYDVASTLPISRGGTGLNSSVANRILATDGSNVVSWTTTVPTAVQQTIAHSNLTGLTSGDDHTQYALLAGRAGGQTLIGGTAAGNNLTLQSTSNVTRGQIRIADQLLADDIDALTATTFKLGKSTATKVEIAKSSIITEILGTLKVKDHIDTITGVPLEIGPATATQVVLGNAAASSVDALTLMRVTPGSGKGLDVATAGTLFLGENIATAVTIADTGVTTNVRGALAIQGSMDTIAAGAMTIGATNATSITLAKTTVKTTVAGELEVKDIIDTVGAAILKLGPANATAVEIGDTGVDTYVKGDLYVLGTTTTVNSETVNIADNFLYLNQGYGTVSAVTGGLAINYLPTATTTTAASPGFANPDTINTVGAATFAAGDIIQISGAVQPENDGLYVVLSHAANVITLDTTVYGWNQTAVTTGVDAVAVIRKVAISVIRANTSGDWQVAKGSAVPLSFANLATASSKWTYSLINTNISATSTTYTDAAYFNFDFTEHGTATVATIRFYAIVSGRNLDVEIFDGTSSIGSLTGTSATGHYSFTFTVPGSNKLLQLRVRKVGSGGTSPSIRSALLIMSS
jgi:hypothetical protein